MKKWVVLISLFTSVCLPNVVKSLGPSATFVQRLADNSRDAVRAAILQARDAPGADGEDVRPEVAFPTVPLRLLLSWFTSRTNQRQKMIPFDLEGYDLSPLTPYWRRRMPKS